MGTGARVEEEVLYSSSPAMFQNRPVLFLVVAALCGVGVGIPILVVWYLSCRATILTVTDRRSILRRGILSKRTTEVWHRDVRNVQLSQSLLQCIFGVGDLAVSSSGQSGMEIDVKGVPDPLEAKEIIDDHRGL